MMQVVTIHAGWHPTREGKYSWVDNTDVINKYLDEGWNLKSITPLGGTGGEVASFCAIVALEKKEK